MPPTIYTSNGRREREFPLSPYIDPATLQLICLKFTTYQDVLEYLQKRMNAALVRLYGEKGAPDVCYVDYPVEFYDLLVRAWAAVREDDDARFHQTAEWVGETLYGDRGRFVEPVGLPKDRLGEDEEPAELPQPKKTKRRRKKKT